MKVIVFLGQYVFNILILLDQALNVVLLGAPDETVSSRTGRAMESGKPKWFVPPFARALDWVSLEIFKDDNHAEESIEPESHREGEIWSWIEISKMS